MNWMTTTVDLLLYCSIAPLATIRDRGYDKFEPFEVLRTFFGSSEVRAK